MKIKIHLPLWVLRILPRRHLFTSFSEMMAHLHSDQKQVRRELRQALFCFHSGRDAVMGFEAVVKVIIPQLAEKHQIIHSDQVPGLVRAFTQVVYPELVKAEKEGRICFGDRGRQSLAKISEFLQGHGYPAIGPEYTGSDQEYWPLHYWINQKRIPLILHGIPEKTVRV